MRGIRVNSHGRGAVHHHCCSGGVVVVVVVDVVVDENRLGRDGLEGDHLGSVWLSQGFQGAHEILLNHNRLCVHVA